MREAMWDLPQEFLVHTNRGSVRTPNEHGNCWLRTEKLGIACSSLLRQVRAPILAQTLMAVTYGCAGQFGGMNMHSLEPRKLSTHTSGTAAAEPE